MQISPFDPSQYESLAGVLMAAYGTYSFDAENLRYRDELLNTKYLHKRWAALYEGDCVAFGEYSQTPEMNEPGTFLLNIAVHPEHQKRGIGTRLYLCASADISAHQPRKLRASSRADNTRSVAFLKHRGFTVGKSIKELQLDIVAPPQSVHQNAPEAELLGTDITIETMQSLEADPNRNRKLFDLVSAIRAEMPTPHPINAVPFDEFVAGFLLTPSRLPDATFVAVNSRSREYVGFSYLIDDGKNGMIAGLTGVKREYRKRGIASALKRSGFRYAESYGFNSITTFNAVENAAIAAVNKHFGFTEKFTWLHFEKHVSNG